jgi:hypothetical protein
MALQAARDIPVAAMIAEIGMWVSLSRIGSNSDGSKLSPAWAVSQASGLSDFLCKRS